MLNSSPKDVERNWAALLLAAAVVALVFQLFPSLWSVTLSGLDLRNWSRTTWLLGNLVFLVMLLGIRLGPALADALRNRETSAHGRQKPRQMPHPLPIEDVRVLMQRDEQRRARVQRKLALYGVVVLIVVLGLAAGFSYINLGHNQEVRAANTLLHNNPGADLRRGVTGVVGTRFRVRPGRDLRVTHLGIYDSGGDGLQREYRVGIFANGAQASPRRGLVAQTLIPHGRHALLEGHFRWMPLAQPAELQAGGQYILAAESYGGWLGRGADDEQALADGWPAHFDEVALREDGFDQAWNSAIVGVETDGGTLLIGDQPWPAMPDREEPTGGPAYGFANLIVAQGD